MTLTKADIVERVAERLNCSKAEAAALVESLFEIVKEKLAVGEVVKLSGFGSFRVRQKRSRRGRNPQTGETLVIEGRRVISFRASPVLRRSLEQRPPATRMRRAASEG